MNKMLDIKEIDDNYYIKLSAFMEVQDKYNWYEEEYHKLVKDYYKLYDQLIDAKKQIKDINKANQRNVSKLKKIKVCLNKNRVYIHGERNLAFELDDILEGDPDV